MLRYPAANPCYPFKAACSCYPFTRSLFVVLKMFVIFFMLRAPEFTDAVVTIDFAICTVVIYFTNCAIRSCALRSALAATDANGSLIAPSVRARARGGQSGKSSKIVIMF